MDQLGEVAPAFVEMAHRIVWCSAASVDRQGRPRTRILHPLWQWDGTSLVGWIATGPTPVKRAHLEHSPYLSLSYWAPSHDTCTAEVRASWHLDDETCEWLWDAYAQAAEPVGYDPAIVPPWSDGPRSPAFAALRVDAWRLRVFPGTLLLAGEGRELVWQEEEAAPRP